MIRPISHVQKSFALPGSKSISNRVLIIAALAPGTSTITNIARCDDTGYMMKVLSLVGIKTREAKKHLEILGTGGMLDLYKHPLSIGNAGTCMRFLTTFLTLGKTPYILDGNERMRERPIRDLSESLKTLGVSIEYIKKEGFPPLKINADGFPGGKVEISGEKSSQYLTSLLLTAPYGKKDFSLTISGEITSRPYLDMTLLLMEQFGININRISSSEYTIKVPQEYTPGTYSVEGDASSASYFFAAAALTGSRISITNLPAESLQGDSKFADVLEEMGCTVNRTKDTTEVIGQGQLKGIDIDLNEMPDMVQTLGVVALFATGKTTIRNVANLRIKETDRITALVNELRKLGAEVKEFDDGLEISPVKKILPAVIETYDDHRMAMSFAVAGLREPGITIENPNVVSKSFPEFFDYLEELYK